MADWIRALFLEATTPKFQPKRYEDHTEKIPLHWIVDAKSVYDHLVKETGMPADKRLAIETAALRQLSKRPGERIHWIDTSQMISDTLTKDLGHDGAGYVFQQMQKETWTVTQSEQAAKKKAHQRELRQGRRRKAKEEKETMILGKRKESGCESYARKLPKTTSHTPSTTSSTTSTTTP